MICLQWNERSGPVTPCLKKQVIESSKKQPIWRDELRSLPPYEGWSCTAPFPFIIVVLKIYLVTTSASKNKCKQWIYVYLSTNDHQEANGYIAFEQIELPKVPFFVAIFKALGEAMSLF